LKGPGRSVRLSALVLAVPVAIATDERAPLRRLRAALATRAGLHARRNDERSDGQNRHDENDGGDHSLHASPPRAGEVSFPDAMPGIEPLS
jgi:hypothetical protein